MQEGSHNETDAFELGDDEYDCFVDYRGDVVWLDDIDAKKAEAETYNSSKMDLSRYVASSKELREELSSVILGRIMLSIQLFQAIITPTPAKWPQKQELL